MITVTKTFTFDSAHCLPNHPGLCKNLHGHTYKLEVTVTRRGLELDRETGMVIDFGHINDTVKPVIARLDHSYLNDIKDLEMPTAENMLRYLAKTLNFPETVRLTRMRIWETPNSYAEWTE